MLALLNVSSNNLRSLTGLGGHRRLQELWASHNRLRHASDLRGLTQLRILDFAHNSFACFEDMAMLATNRGLSVILLRGNPIERKQKRDLFAGLRALVPSLLKLDPPNAFSLSHFADHRSLLLSEPVLSVEVLESVDETAQDFSIPSENEKQNMPH